MSINENDENSKLPLLYTNGTFAKRRGEHPINSLKDMNPSQHGTPRNSGKHNPRQHGAPSSTGNNRANDDLARRMQLVSKRAALTGKRKVCVCVGDM